MKPLFLVLVVLCVVLNVCNVRAIEPQPVPVVTAGDGQTEITSQDPATQKALARVKAAGLALTETKYYRSIKN